MPWNSPRRSRRITPGPSWVYLQMSHIMCASFLLRARPRWALRGLRQCRIVMDRCVRRGCVRGHVWPLGRFRRYGLTAPNIAEIAENKNRTNCRMRGLADLLGLGQRGPGSNTRSPIACRDRARVTAGMTGGLLQFFLQFGSLAQVSASTGSLLRRARMATPAKAMVAPMRMRVVRGSSRMVMPKKTPRMGESSVSGASSETS